MSEAPRASAGAAPAGQISWWPAPAKLNLFLHVTGRRADGYHELQTLFQLIDRCDDIGLATRSDGRIERVVGMPQVEPDQDLAVRAARALQRASGCRLGCEIHVHKRIPSGGGLGGGSSDAATVLIGLNRLWGLGWDLGALAGLGLRLGADVPVFVGGASAWGEGLGERLRPVELPPRWYLVIDPGVSVSTAQIFQAPELTRNSPLITIDAFSAGRARNDCEPVVRARYPVVAKALDWLGAQAQAFEGAAVGMTGTGACVFAGFPRAEDAQHVAACLPEGWSAFVARGLQRSPLHAML